MYIETKRLIITEFNENMAKQLHLNSLDEETRNFLKDEVFKTEEEALQTIQYLMECYESGPFVYPVLLKDGSLIGYVELVKIDLGYEVGYQIAQPYRCLGYASEALDAFLKTINFKEVYGVCVDENTASKRVLEKVGFECISTKVGKYQGEQRKISVFKKSL